MDKAQSDLVVWYRLETEFFRDHVRHTRYLGEEKDRNRKVKEDWSNCGELGKGGFGVVHKQIQKSTGHYRAVKTVDKSLPHKLDYSRELLVMAILAKRPSLFVEFLGWFEEPETLYIAMEYLEEGDLTKHIGTPLRQETVRNISKQILEGLEVMHEQGIAHRDLKPANIFVVRMSPVWVKIGDFGISKRILPQDTTTLHTQVATPVYSAPEVLGLDSDSETSDYTNSVDIWSLGCVVYELLAGTKLFLSEGQASLFYLEKWPFPENKLKACSPPTDHVGISLLKSMLAIKPKDRPTAADALRHAWFVGLESDNEDSESDHDKMTQSRGESSLSGRSENKLASYYKQKKNKNEGSPITQDDTKHTPGDMALGANPGLRGRSDSATPESAIDTSVKTPPAAAFVESSLLQPAPPIPELMSHGFQTTHSKSPEARSQNRTVDASQTSPKSSTTSTKLKNPSIEHSATWTNGARKSTPKKTHKAPAFILDETTARITHQRAPPIRQSRFKSDDSHMSKDKVSRNSAPEDRVRGDSRNQNVTTTDPTEIPNTRRNSDIGRNPNCNPNTGWNPNRYPKAEWNPEPRGIRNLSRNSNSLVVESMPNQADGARERSEEVYGKQEE
ncbi:kinase-like domain-containing protein [Tuber brumale]|nr:kinase-like domain-containing protein [Tuber brumale]